MTRARREPPTADHMLEVLRARIFAPPAFTLLTGVRSAVGTDVPNLRIADGAAIDTSDASTGPAGIVIHGIEVKRTAEDLGRELEEPEKAEEIGRFCDYFDLVLPAPAGRLLGSRRLARSRLTLPKRWGLIEVDGDHAEWLVYAERRHPEPRPDGFLKALFRAAGYAVEREASGEGGAPLERVELVEGGGFVVLACDHRILAPIPKAGKYPGRLPCWKCADGKAPDPEALAARLEAMRPDRLDPLAAVLRKKRPELFGPGLAAGAPAAAEGARGAA